MPLKPLDNDCLPGWTQTRGNGKNKWFKQYMIIIASRRRKLSNQNWRYNHRNNHFGLNVDFRGLFSYLFRDYTIFRVFQGPFQGYQPFQGFFKVSRSFRGDWPPCYRNLKCSRTTKNIVYLEKETFLIKKITYSRNFSSNFIYNRVTWMKKIYVRKVKLFLTLAHFLFFSRVLR